MDSIERTQYSPQTKFDGASTQISFDVVSDNGNLPGNSWILGEIKTRDHELEERPGRLPNHGRLDVRRGLERGDEGTRTERELIRRVADVFCLVGRDQRGWFRAGVWCFSLENAESGSEDVIAKVRRRQADNHRIVSFVLGRVKRFRSALFPSGV